VNADDIAKRVLQMHAHERRLGLFQIAGNQCQVHGAIDVIFVAIHSELTDVGLYRLLGDALHRTFLFQPVANQVGDGADLEIVTLREQLEIGTTRHGAVVVQDLDDGRGRLDAGETRKIATRLGVSGASEHATGLRHQRKDMSGLA
jgi:hypothetical protein